MKVININYREKERKFSISVEIELEGQKYFLSRELDFRFDYAIGPTSKYQTASQIALGGTQKITPDEKERMAIARDMVSDFMVAKAFENYDNLESLKK